jgi:DNA-directed RNA polymerase subunit RPC12/RpoP
MTKCPAAQGIFLHAVKIKVSIISAAYELSKKPQLACEYCSSHAFCMNPKISDFHKSLFFNEINQL